MKPKRIDSCYTKPFELLIKITDREQCAICKLIETKCANYDALYEYASCVPRDLRCYMRGEHYGGWMCPYFEKYVLPLDNELMNLFYPQEMKPCKWCGKPFPINGRQVYCGDKCAELGRQKDDREWHRRNKG